MATFNSPSICITERFDIRPELPDGNNVLLLGFTSEGVPNLPFYVNSIADFEVLFGRPEANAPEQKYAYFTARKIIDSGANLIFVKLPYGAEEGYDTTKDHTALIFPVAADPTSASFIKGYTSNVFIPASAFGALSADYPFDDDIEPGEFISTSTFASGSSVLSAYGASALNTVEGLDCEGFVFGEPVQLKLSESEYEKIQCGGFNWSDQFTCDTDEFSAFNPETFGRAGLVIIDKARSRTSDLFEGYYVTVTDNFDADPATDFDSVSGIKYNNGTAAFGTWNYVPDERICFDLTSTPSQAIGSVSESVANLPILDLPFEDAEYKDFLNITLWRLRPSNSSGDTTCLRPVIVENHYGSLNVDRVISRQGAPRTAFLENIVNRDSNRLDVLVNPFLSSIEGWCTQDGHPARQVRMYREETVPLLSGTPLFGCFENYADNMYSLGCFIPKQFKPARDVGNIPLKIKNALCTVDNPNRVDIDLSVEGGLGTIWTTVKEDRNQWITGDQRDQSFRFNDEVFLNVKADLGRQIGGDEPGEMRNHWQTVFDCFEIFASTTRVCNGGVAHLHIADVLRHILVNGRDCKVFESAKKTGGTFSECIYWPLRNLLRNVNSSYAATYAQWVLGNDIINDKLCWMPFSGLAAATMINTEFPWLAPAGFNRGVLGTVPGTQGVLDLAVDPVLRDRDLLEKIQANAVYFDNTYGNTIFHQQTLSKANTSVREIAIRRLLLWLQKNTMETLKPFIFEPNTVFTRTRARSAVTPIFDLAFNNQGLVDYQISLDANTGETIEDGCLIFDFFIKPARAIYKIKLNFNVARNDQAFSELIV